STSGLADVFHAQSRKKAIQSDAPEGAACTGTSTDCPVISDQAHQPPEQSQLRRQVEQVLGMPLHPVQGPAPVRLNRLHDTVEVAADHGQSRSRSVDGLVMQTVYPELRLAADGRQLAPFVEADLLCRQQTLAVVGQPTQVANVLVQGAAKDHVDELRAAADTEQRQVVVQRAADPVDLETVAVGIHLDLARQVAAVMLGAD